MLRPAQLAQGQKPQTRKRRSVALGVVLSSTAPQQRLNCALLLFIASQRPPTQVPPLPAGRRRVPLLCVSTGSFCAGTAQVVAFAFLGALAAVLLQLFPPVRGPNSCIWGRGVGLQVPLGASLFGAAQSNAAAPQTGGGVCGFSAPIANFCILGGAPSRSSLCPQPSSSSRSRNAPAPRSSPQDGVESACRTAKSTLRWQPGMVGGWPQPRLPFTWAAERPTRGLGFP